MCAHRQLGATRRLCLSTPESVKPLPSNIRVLDRDFEFITPALVGAPGSPLSLFMVDDVDSSPFCSIVISMSSFFVEVA